MVNLAELAAVPMKDEAQMRMVEIIVLKWKCPEVETKCAERIIRHTSWPFKLTMYDNRPNTPNTSRIWNKLIRESTCPYVCVMDSDVFVEPSDPCWLTRMMETFLVPDCRLVLPLTNRCSNPAQKAERADPYSSIAGGAGVWSGFCFLMKPSLLDEVGPFDEEFVGYGQDSEFAARLARNGGGAYIRRDVWMEHLHGSSFKAAQSSGEHDATADRAYAQELYLRKTA
jgi:hypothetical protein